MAAELSKFASREELAEALARAVAEDLAAALARRSADASATASAGTDAATNADAATSADAGADAATNGGASTNTGEGEGEGEGATASLFLPGGTTPAPFMEALARLPLPWAHICAAPGDERCVPPTSERSNERLIRRHLLQGPAAAARFAPLFTEGRSTGAAARALAPLLPPDVLVLGMGADMHTASLFPRAPGLEQALAADAPPVAALPAADGEARLTLTAPSIARAGSCYILITGPEKLAALERALALLGHEDAALEAPVCTALARTGPTAVFHAA